MAMKDAVLSVYPCIYATYAQQIANGNIQKYTDPYNDHRFTYHQAARIEDEINTYAEEIAFGRIRPYNEAIVPIS
jgi:YD repeat-containing protein